MFEDILKLLHEFQTRVNDETIPRHVLKTDVDHLVLDIEVKLEDIGYQMAEEADLASMREEEWNEIRNLNLSASPFGCRLHILRE